MNRSGKEKSLLAKLASNLIISNNFMKGGISMKKIIVILMTILLAATMTACYEDNDTTKNTTLENAIYEDVSTSNEEYEETYTAQTETKSENKTELKQNATIEEILIYDENDVKITATELSYNNYEAELKLMIENNSNKSLSFIAGSLGHSGNSVNGYMYNGGYLNCDVSAGKKAMDSIGFSYNELSLYGINEIADIEIDIEIEDDDYNKIYTGPLQIKTTAYDSYDYTIDSYKDAISSNTLQSKYDYSLNYSSEDILYDVNGIRLISEMLFKNKDGDDIILLEIENNSDEIVNIGISDIALNGLTIESGNWTSKTVNMGKRCVVDMAFSNMIEKNIWDLYGIDKIGEIEFNLVVRGDSYDKIIDSSDIKITIPKVKSSFDNSGEEIYNNNGIRIVSKKAIDDSSAYSNDIHIMLLAENSSTKDIYITDEYDSFSVNGFMMDYSFYGQTISAGKSVILEIKLWDMYLDDSNVSCAEDIENFEITLKIKDDNYNGIDTPTISVTY
ncbi:MAG: hypothetical protein NC395_04360 [Prevotella sp.]|nr:hypothetical protein [Prevotella sp.]